MTAPVYFHDDFTGLEVGKPFTFTGSEAHHACVMRVAPGEEIHLVDGHGLRVISEVISAADKSVTVRPREIKNETSIRPVTTLVQALAKGGRDEQAVEMATEVGIDKVIAWQSQRTIVKWEGKKQGKNLEKWSNLLKAATKQSRRSRIPTVDYAESTKSLLNKLTDAKLLVLHESGEHTLEQIPTEWFDTTEIALIVGPEGGITEAELAAFTAQGAQIVRIGNTVMRSSTAGTVALALVNYLSGRYNQN
ncbi:RNA methyltransferase, RsmE family [Gleimia coleocanis DSM 15436]|uniref:Ribosomal RNA small subunit methyltransferase E n=1 Tax=Gleimia coleocanis DSM 15436 TaxID=525245 RepID=C0W0A0_9ACTO|nr:16S rRNA (uracil(1498)-N(3))-methyltransferase [Gleimia coleocanis]EEH63959.1 RNA methyltransferase, RsmE family [Gleimia coleocanis DSM 15436]